MSKLGKLLALIRAPRLTRRVLSLCTSGYLVETGWTRSVRDGSPVDYAGRPLPWVTLPYIDFIESRLRSSVAVFEYGSGASTLFYAQRVAKVDAVEHDPVWFAKLKLQLPGTARVRLVPLDQDGEYARSIGNWGERYDLVIVDGRDRVNCIRQSIAHLADGGCLVLDDSERSEYRAGCDFMAQHGYKRLDFWGMAPALTYKKCTSIFYPQTNCLAI